jgi:hypothetical protein
MKVPYTTLASLRALLKLLMATMLDEQVDLVLSRVIENRWSWMLEAASLAQEGSVFPVRDPIAHRRESRSAGVRLGFP